MVSVKNGISSERVRSSPNANAIVESFFIEFKRSCVYAQHQYAAPSNEAIREKKKKRETQL